MGEDLRRFIGVMKRFRYIVDLKIGFSKAYSFSFNGYRTWLALIDFNSLREGSISDLVYRIGGLISDQEVRNGVEMWKIL